MPRLTSERVGGGRNGAELRRRIRADRFRGSPGVVTEWATRQRRAETYVWPPAGRRLAARKIARMMTMGRNHLSGSDAVLAARIETAVPALALAGRFTNMVRYGEHGNFDDRLTEAEDGLLAAFARGLRADKSAVMAALREPWSNGRTEGQTNKLKTLKRQMYGRAGIDLLRARLVPAA